MKPGNSTITVIATTLVIFICANTYAQSVSIPRGIKTTTAGNKTTGTEISRLRAHINYEFDGTSLVYSDSSNYFYSGDNAYDDKTGEWKFDSVYYYGGAKPGFKDSHTFNSNGDITETLSQSWSNPLQAWVNGTRKEYKYNSSNQLIEDVSALWNSSTMTWQYTLPRYRYVYTGGKLSDVFLELPAGPNWLNHQWGINIYSGTQLVKDSTVKWNSGTSTWEPYRQSFYYYDVNGDNIKIEDQSWDNMTSQWNNDQEVTNTFDNGHNKLTEIIRISPNGSYENYSKKVWTYNGFNQPVTEDIQHWDGTQWAYQSASINGDGKRTFYYDVFNASVSDTKDDERISLFPSPANYVINIDIDFGKPTSFAASIYDITGKAVKKWNQNNVAQYSEAVDISTLPTGQYILRITGEGVNLSRSFSHIE